MAILLKKTNFWRVVESSHPSEGHNATIVKKQIVTPRMKSTVRRRHTLAVYRLRQCLEKENLLSSSVTVAPFNRDRLR
jgi:hypothetical protein